MFSKLNFAVSASLIAIAITTSISACTKDDDDDQPATSTCTIRGTYTGTNQTATSNPNPLSYTFKDDNFAVGSLSPGGAGVTFGGYRTTCDSVIISAYYTGNGSYYLLQGKFSDNKNTISGTFKNLTNTSDFGTFTIKK